METYLKMSWFSIIFHRQFGLGLILPSPIPTSVTVQAPVESKSIGLVGGVMLLINNLAGGQPQDVPGSQHEAENN